MAEEPQFIGPEPVGPAPSSEGAESAIRAEAVEPETFDRAYVEDLRKENAKWRTQLREREQLFEGIDPDEQAALAEFARLSKKAEAGDEEASAALAEMLGIEPDQGEPEEPAPVQPQFSEADLRRFAREEAERITYDRDMTSRVESIQNTARGWGFTVTPGEPGYSRYQRLCYLATNEVDPDTSGGDLMGAAKSMLEAEELADRQQIINDYLAGKGMAAETSPLVPNITGAAPASRKQPWDPDMTPEGKWAAVRNSLHERLSAEQG